MGESGTGKELVADALHKFSSRSGGPFIKVNCAALPGQLLESELFGYEKGAFTGAVKDKPGRFMLAGGGSIFLDEIGELPLDIQVKLLRVLQERMVEPLGSIKSVSVDVRIICATNRDLLKEVQSGHFRDDLYFRLIVLEVIIPPLRERPEDLPLLVNSLLRRLSRKNHLEKKYLEDCRVSPAFLEALTAYSWPGNVRELENILERALILSRSDVLGIEALPENFRVDTHPKLEKVPEDTPEADVASRVSPLEKAEYEILLKTLRQYNGHRERTADALGISRRSLQYKLKKFCLIRQWPGF
jgi:two-component system NtrC family response regulator